MHGRKQSGFLVSFRIRNRGEYACVCRDLPLRGTGGGSDALTQELELIRTFTALQRHSVFCAYQARHLQNRDKLNRVSKYFSWSRSRLTCDTVYLIRITIIRDAIYIHTYMDFRAKIIFFISLHLFCIFYAC